MSCAGVASPNEFYPKIASVSIADTLEFPPEILYAKSRIFTIHTGKNCNRFASDKFFSIFYVSHHVLVENPVSYSIEKNPQPHRKNRYESRMKPAFEPHVPLVGSH